MRPGITPRRIPYGTFASEVENPSFSTPFLSYRASVGNPILSLLVAGSHLSREEVESTKRIVGEVMRWCRVFLVVAKSMSGYFHDRMEGIHVIVLTLTSTCSGHSPKQVLRRYESRVFELVVFDAHHIHHDIEEPEGRSCVHVTPESHSLIVIRSLGFTRYTYAGQVNTPLDDIVESPTP